MRYENPNPPKVNFGIQDKPALRRPLLPRLPQQQRLFQAELQHRLRRHVDARACHHHRPLSRIGIRASAPDFAVWLTAAMASP